MFDPCNPLLDSSIPILLSLCFYGLYLRTVSANSLRKSLRSLQRALPRESLGHLRQVCEACKTFENFQTSDHVMQMIRSTLPIGSMECSSECLRAYSVWNLNLDCNCLSERIVESGRLFKQRERERRFKQIQVLNLVQEYADPKEDTDEEDLEKEDLERRSRKRIQK